MQNQNALRKETKRNEWNEKKEGFEKRLFSKNIFIFCVEIECHFSFKELFQSRTNECSCATQGLCNDANSMPVSARVNAKRVKWPSFMTPEKIPLDDVDIIQAIRMTRL